MPPVVKSNKRMIAKQVATAIIIQQVASKAISLEAFKSNSVSISRSQVLSGNSNVFLSKKNKASSLQTPEHPRLKFMYVTNSKECYLEAMNSKSACALCYHRLSSAFLKAEEGASPFFEPSAFQSLCHPSKHYLNELKGALSSSGVPSLDTGAGFLTTGAVTAAGKTIGSLLSPDLHTPAA